MFLGQDTPLILPPRAVPVDPKVGADHQPLGALLGIAMAQEGCMLLTPGPSSPGTPGPALAEHRIERGKPRPGMPPAGASSCSARRGQI